MKDFIHRIKVGLPKDSLNGFSKYLRWVLFGIYEHAYDYGMCNTYYCRRHKRTGIVFFILRKKGEQKHVDGIGHKEDVWFPMHRVYWPKFVPLPKVINYSVTSKD